MVYFMPHLETTLERNQSALPHARRILDAAPQRRYLRWFTK